MGIKNELKEKRNKEIFKLREAGKSWGEIAEKYDISRNRVKVIYNKLKAKI